MRDFVDVASLDELPPGANKTVTVEGYAIALFNVEGRIFATADECADQGYSLGSFGTLSGEVVECNFHFWRFNVRTGESVEPEGEAIHCFPVRVEGERILVRPMAGDSCPRRGAAED